MLDTADDAGQLFGGGIGVVAHLCEHALVLAGHACGEVAGGDRLQQAGQRLQVAVGSGHQGVEALHHQAEVELELVGIAACGEVAAGRGLCQVLDLLVHRGQVGLDLVHRRGDGGLFAGQARHVFAQVADGVALYQVDGLHLHLDVAGHQFVGVAGHAAEVTGECGGIHAEADLAFFVALGHVELCGDQVAHLALHAVHGVQQAAGFVVGGAAHIVVERSVGDRLGGQRGLAERAHQAAGDHPAEQATEQQHGNAAADQHRAATCHCGGGVFIGGLGALALQCRILGQGALPRFGGRGGLLHQHGQRFVGFGGEPQFGHLRVGLGGSGAGRIDLVAPRLGLGRCREHVQGLAGLFVGLCTVLDQGRKAQIVFLRSGQYQVAQLHGNHRGVVGHVLQVLHDRDVAVDHGVQPFACLRQRVEARSHQGAGQQDQYAEGKAQARAHVVALKESGHFGSQVAWEGGSALARHAQGGRGCPELGRRGGRGRSVRCARHAAPVRVCLCPVTALRLSTEQPRPFPYGSASWR